MRGKQISLFNKGKMKRDFTYADDIVEGVIASLFTSGLPSYSIFNLGNNRPEDLMDMVKMIEEALGKKASTSLQPMQPGDIPSSHADIHLAGTLLGYQPKVALNEGIKRFVQWYRENPDIADAVAHERNTKQPQTGF